MKLNTTNKPPKKDHTALNGLSTELQNVITSIVNNDIGPAMVLDEAMHIVLANHAFFDCYQRFWGITAEEGKRLGNGVDAPGHGPLNTMMNKANEALSTQKSVKLSHQIPGPKQSLELKASFTPISNLVYVSFSISPIDREKQTQDFLNNILLNISEVVICFDQMGDITYWNRGAENLFELTQMEMEGSNIRKLDTRLDHATILNNLKTKERPLRTNWTFKKDDGSKVHLKVSTDLMFDARNKITGIIATGIDITEAQKLQRIIDNTHKAALVGGWEINLTKQSPIWTEETYKIHDVPIGKKVTLEEAFEFYHVDDRPKLQAAFEKLMADGSPYDMEIRFVTAKNVHKWVRVIGQKETDDNGEITILGTIQDITKRKKAEEKERASDILFKNTFENAGIGMALVDISGVLIDANPYMVKLLGFPKKELLKKSFPEFTHTDDIEKDLHLFQKTLSGEIDVYEMPKRYITANGDVVWVQLNVSMYRNEAGEALMAIAMVQDITEKVKAEQEIKQLNIDLEKRVEERTKELTEINKEMETFSYLMSHDLRTPLRSALLFSDILGRKYLDGLSEKGAEIYQHMKSSLVEMDQLVNDLLEYAKIRNNTIKANTINTDHLLDEVLTDVKKHYEEISDLTIEVEKLPAVKGDITLLYHAFRNIISNSFKYRKEDASLKLSIKVHQKDKHTVTFALQDNGKGFDQKFCEEIFKPFERLVLKSDVQGSGIGLSIVERIINKHNGSVRAEGEEGKGACFYVTLPLAKV